MGRIEVRLPMELEKALVEEAEAEDRGTKSDAVRRILASYFSENRLDILAEKQEQLIQEVAHVSYKMALLYYKRTTNQQERTTICSTIIRDCSTKFLSVLQNHLSALQNVVQNDTECSTSVLQTKQNVVQTPQKRPETPEEYRERQLRRVVQCATSKVPASDKDMDIALEGLRLTGNMSLPEVLKWLKSRIRKENPREASKIKALMMKLKKGELGGW